ncbi:Retrovirus-related Pol polyprotein from transposon RE1 [Vitis vinifera]|uniref:Retrovirus-related Pol polyprotein from transposon RE1 n=1 Tax=Vitis vinifera TaxID=29760 RepID=A0A438J874_VITVI|nr:Retrovirus-related Pol polyprotein from transposon RE1 [Vitis vinifera]
MIESQYNAKVRVLRSDNGGEYQSSDLQKYLEGHDIIHQTTCSNTPQQNGVAERKNRHLLEVVRASLIAAKTPISYWGEAITSTAYLINRGEYHKKIQTLDYDYHISEEDESGQSELEALADPRWKAAMNEEMKSLQKNETWELVECHQERTKINTVRVLLSLATNLDWPLQQFDVKMSFCMANYLKKYIWIFHKDAWCQKSNVRSNSDHTLFLKKQHGKITTLIVYVDDMVVTGNDPEERKALQNYLSREFEMKDLGPLKYFLGIEVSRSSEGIFLSQRKYALDLLQETKMSGCQPVNTPIEEAHTRPDLAYALSVVSQYMHNPGEQHMNAVMRILRYLKNAPGKGILFAKNVDHQSIKVYTDADWAGAVDDRRSTSGYFTFVGGNLVTWKSKKQNVVARSSAEAKFRGMALGLCEALWLRILLQDLGYLSRQPIRLFCDNKAACDIAHNPVQHDRTKHVEVDRFFIKEKLDDKIVELPKIRSEDQLADILTKVVSSQVFSKFLDKLGMCDIYAPT